MKQFEPITQLLNALFFLNKQEFNKYLGSFLSSVGVIALLATYFINARSSSLVAHIKTLHEASRKSTEILTGFEKLQNEETKLATKLDENKDFNIRSFFEKFCKQADIAPENGWADSIETNELPLYPQFEEEIIRPAFKNQTTQTLIKLFEALEKEDRVMIKEIHLTAEGAKLNALLTIAGKKHAAFKKTDE